MIQAKTFSLDDYAGFNKFVTEHSPRGENGVKITNTHLIVFYEDGELMSKSDRIQSLRFELGKHLEQQMHYEKQMRLASKIRDSFDQKEQLISWQNGNAQFNQTRKMLELEIINTAIVLEMLSELGVILEVTHSTLLPEIIEEKIASPFPGKTEGEAKKGKK